MKYINKIVFVILLLSSYSYANSDYDNGHKVFNKWCLPCHGARMPGTNALAVVYKGTGISAVLEKRTDLASEYIAYVVRNGKHSMPFFRKVEISDKQLQELSVYLTSKKK